jgi:hypothetical protein
MRGPEGSCSFFFSISGSSTVEEFSKTNRLIEFDFRLERQGPVEAEPTTLTGEFLNLS